MPGNVKKWKKSFAPSRIGRAPKLGAVSENFSLSEKGIYLSNVHQPMTIIECCGGDFSRLVGIHLETEVAPQSQVISYACLHEDDKEKWGGLRGLQIDKS
jgi:hypothetical protein